MWLLKKYNRCLFLFYRRSGFFLLLFSQTLWGAPSKPSGVFSGNTSCDLAKAVAKKSSLTILKGVVRRFADQEIFVQVHKERGIEKVFVIQSMVPPVNDSLMTLLIIGDALKRNGSKKIYAICPYMGYSRQDRQSSPGTAISSKLVADLLEKSGFHHVITCDLHAEQIQGFYNIPVQNLYTTELFASDIRKRFSQTNHPLMIVSPDAGGIKRARALAQKLDLGLIIVDKRRDKPGQSKVMQVIGNPRGSICILVDDIVDSGGTLCNAAVVLREHGAKAVHVYCTHGILSGGARIQLSHSPIETVTLTDSIPDATLPKNFRTLSLAGLISSALEKV
jgi:ribose-phosphate pyrophosphokinase